MGNFGFVSSERIWLGIIMSACFLDVGAKSKIGLVGLPLLSLRDGAAAFAFAAALDPCCGLPRLCTMHTCHHGNTFVD